MNAKEKREVKELLELAADLSFAKSKLNPDWPVWRKQEFWKELDPAIADYKARAKSLTGSYVTL
jgi:hypothetical protein